MTARDDGQTREGRVPAARPEGPGPGGGPEPGGPEPAGGPAASRAERPTRDPACTGYG